VGYDGGVKLGYKQKFEGLLRLCEEAKANGTEVVVISEPQALGDNYVEIIESLNRIADANLQLAIVPRKQRN